jgi:hypothetical protein
MRRATGRRLIVAFDGDSIQRGPVFRALDLSIQAPDSGDPFIDLLLQPIHLCLRVAHAAANLNGSGFRVCRAYEIARC